MKRYIKSESTLPNFTDLFDSIDTIIIVDDVNADYSRLNITAATSLGGEDFDSYTKRELTLLSDDELEEIDSIGALTKLYELHKAGFRYELNPDQLKILRNGWESFTDYRVTKSDVGNVLQMISNCNYLKEPEYRTKEHVKNFAETHNIEMDKADYLNILKSVRADECISKFNGVKKNKGTELFVFMHPGNGYRLTKQQDSPEKQIITDDIKIYIKVSVKPATNQVVSIVSFHDPDAEEQPLFPNYYDTPEILYNLAKLTVQQADILYSRTHGGDEIQNHFKYDDVVFEDNILTITFVDVYDDDFPISLSVTDQITSDNISFYANKFATTLLSEWDSYDTQHRVDF